LTANCLPVAAKHQGWVIFFRRNRVSGKMQSLPTRILMPDLKLPGLKGKVDVYMDDRLVPHIYADNDPDAYYVQGYLHAKFRLWQMEFQTHVAGGRLSEIAGEERLPIDRFFRRLGMVYGAEQTMKKMEDQPEMKAAVQAYSDGVNAYIQSLKPEQLPFEYKLLDYKPEAWTPFKTYLFMMYMAYDLSARGSTSDLQMTNARNYFGYVDFNKLFPNLPDSLDPIIPKGTVCFRRRLSYPGNR
jgi:penicillin amidase